jgi:hypothetical protein
MTMSGSALKRLQQRFNDLRLCKDMLVVPPTEHIVRGFLFERTPYKGLFYFWRVVVPLYTQWSVITLGYSKRLSGGNYIDLSEPEFEQSVRGLSEIIANSELDDLRSICGPQEFLDRFGGASVNEGYVPLIYPFDAALTYYLVGKRTFCLDILDDYAAQDLKPGMVDIHYSARDLAREMRIDPSAGDRKVRALETTSIERFALGSTMIHGHVSQTDRGIRAS